MITTVTVKDSDLPVLLDDAKRHLRVMDGSQDEYIQSLISAATEYCESVTGRALRLSATLTQKYCQWPCNPVRFNRNPVKSITSVTYYDADNVSQTVSSSNYRLHASSEAAAHMEIDGDFVKPTVYTRDDAITVTFVAGYSAATAVPETAKHAIRMIVGHWFNHNEAVSIGSSPSEVPLAAGALLAQLDPGYYR